MKDTRFEGTQLRRILAGMVTDPVVCARISSQWREGGLFDSAWANLVGGWCVRHQVKYGQPPNGQLGSIYDTWASGTDLSDETVKGVERFLSFLSDEWSKAESPPSDYLLDQARQFFDGVKARKAIERAEEHLEAGHTDEAIGELNGTSHVELGAGSLVKPGEDYEVWQEAFDPDRRKPLITWPGPLGKFLGDSFCRDSLIAFMGPDKSSKSMWLLETEFRGLRNRCRVAHFDVGDMARDDVLIRLGQRATRRPLRGGTYTVPVGIDVDGFTSEQRQWKGDLDPGEAFKAFRKVTNGKDVFRLSCHPNSSIGPEGIRGILANWEREGWVADLVVIDYADILAPPMGTREPLEQIDATWKYLRRMSQELHCLVVTASQSSAAAYATGKEGGKPTVLTRRHFSGRKTKLAHVNGMLGINVTDEEKERGECRINWVVRRSAAYSERHTVSVAGCLAICSPAMVSRKSSE